MKRFWRLPVMKLPLVPCSGQDTIETLILSPVPFLLGVGEPTHLPMWLKACSVGFVVASTGVPLQGKKVRSPAVLVCSFENIIVQKISPCQVNYGEERWEKLFQCICCCATKSAALKAEYSSVDHYGFVASKSRCDLGETCLEPRSSSSCQLWCWVAAGRVGVLCPVCSMVSLTCFGSGVPALRLNLLLPFQNNLIPQVIKAT